MLNNYVGAVMKEYMITYLFLPCPVPEENSCVGHREDTCSTDKHTFQLVASILVSWYYLCADCIAGTGDAATAYDKT